MAEHVNLDIPIIWIYRLTTEDMANGQIQAGGGGVMMWKMFSWDTLGPIVPIVQSLTTVFIKLCSLNSKVNFISK